MTRPRDSLFRRVIEAENEFAADHYTKLSNAEMRALAAKLARSAWWKKRRPDDKLIVGYSQGDRNVCSADNLLMGEATHVDLLHAIAHHLHGHDTAWHGPEYAKAMLDLTGKVLGMDERRRLAALYKEHSVKTIQWSQEAKDRAKQRHAETDLKALLEELRGESVTPPA